MSETELTKKRLIWASKDPPKPPKPWYDGGSLDETLEGDRDYVNWRNYQSGGVEGVDAFGNHCVYASEYEAKYRCTPMCESWPGCMCDWV